MNTTVVNIIIITIIMVTDYDYYGMMIIIIIIITKKKTNTLYKIKIIILNTYVRKLDTFMQARKKYEITQPPHTYLHKLVDMNSRRTFIHVSRLEHGDVCVKSE